MGRRTGSVVCPRCERLVGVNESHCPHCGAWQPAMFGYGPAIQRALGGQQIDLTNSITVFCVALFVLALVMDPRAIFQARSFFDFLSPSGAALFRLGMTGGQGWAVGQWWTVCTATFLHGSALHILFNMAILRYFLPNLIELYGAPRSFVIFMAGGIGGFLLSNVATQSYSVGASGAIFGLLGALIAYGRRTGQSQVTNQLWTMALVMFAMGFVKTPGAPNVNVWAHGGGFASGFVAAEFMPMSHRPEGLGVLALAGALVLVTLAGFVLSFIGFAPLLLFR